MYCQQKALFHNVIFTKLAKYPAPSWRRIKKENRFPRLQRKTALPSFLIVRISAEINKNSRPRC